MHQVTLTELRWFSKAVHAGRHWRHVRLSGLFGILITDKGKAMEYTTVFRGCERCDTFGGTDTYANQVTMPIAGKTVCIDWCIHQIVASLNAGGVRTVACCCGHGRIPGRIDLEDGRVLTILPPDTSISKHKKA